MCSILCMWQARTGTTRFAFALCDCIGQVTLDVDYISTWCVKRRTRASSHLNELTDNFT